LSKTCAFITLGCKVNQYDTQVIREVLKGRGYQEVPAHGRADLYVINTCAVTSTGEAKSRQEIRKAVRLNPGSEVVVTGCYAKADPQAIGSLPGVGLVAEKSELIGRLTQGEKDSLLDLGISDFEGHSRAFLKIQDGCDAFCSYCIIPYLRGSVKSRGLGDILAEAHRLVERGYREIVLTGVHLGAYGRDLSGVSLLDVLIRLMEVPDIYRIRLSSLEATEVTDELIELMASSPKLCPHLHLPLQSGDDYILKKMNRRYTVKDYLYTLERVRSKVLVPSFSTDVMVGFPGEEPGHFDNTLEVCQAAGFSRIHIFPYSSRKGTPAAVMSGRCKTAQLKERKRVLEDLAQELALRYKSFFLGKEIEVLVEEEPYEGVLSGYSERYIKALFSGPKELLGRMVTVKVTEVFPGYIKATWKGAL
jgi:threonylcarbamoyladenosine tRNA methylthiotransferase MtaB